MNDLALTPEHQAALRVYASLKEELPQLEEKKAHLLGHEIPYLNALYMRELGDLRMQLLGVQYDNFALKRKMEMIRSARTRGVPVMIDIIDALVGAELKEQREHLEQQAKELEKAVMMLKADPLSDDEATEFKQLYYRLAKLLHPDLNPEQDASRSELWFKVVAAYEAGDLARMRMLAVLAEEGGVVLQLKNDTTLQELVKKINYLSVVVDRLKEEIERIRANFPYTIKEDIGNPQWVTDQRAAIKQQIEALAEETKYFELHITRLLNEDT